MAAIVAGRDVTVARAPSRSDSPRLVIVSSFSRILDPVSWSFLDVQIGNVGWVLPSQHLFYGETAMRRILMLIVVLGLATRVSAQELEINHIRVGQGDATLILGPEDSSGERVTVLIDAGNIPTGGYDGGRIILAVLSKYGLTELDFFIATHYDADHIGGVIAGRSNLHGQGFVFGWDNASGDAGTDDDNDGQTDWVGSSLTMMEPDAEELGTGDDIKVVNFVDRGDTSPPSTQTYTKYRKIADAMGTRHSITNQASVDSFEIDLGDGAMMKCLSANGFVRDRSSRVPRVNTENERSLCFLLEHGGFHYITGGDTIGRTAGRENARVEGAIGEYITAENLQIDMLHVNHHGANNGSETTFLDAIRPEIAIISLGNDNSHHHPNANALERLIAAGVYRIYQTSWGTTTGKIPLEVRRHQAIFQQDIIVRTNGVKYSVSVGFAAAAEDNFSLLAGDASSADLGNCQFASACHTDRTQRVALTSEVLTTSELGHLPAEDDATNVMI